MSTTIPTPAQLMLTDISNKLADALDTAYKLGAYLDQQKRPVIVQPRVAPDLNPTRIVTSVPVKRRRIRHVAPAVPAQGNGAAVPARGNGSAQTRYAPVSKPVTSRPSTKPEPRTRRQGAADRIVRAILSKHGVLASKLSEIAGYPCGPTVLDRLAATHGFAWDMTGEGAKRRYIGTRN